MEKKRSVGVTVFSVLLFILFISSLWFLYFFRKQSQGYERIFSLIMIITCPTASYGIFTLKRWARVLALCIALLILVYFIGGLILGYFSSDEARAYFALLLYIYLPFIIFGITSIYYLTRPKVKEQFR